MSGGIQYYYSTVAPRPRSGKVTTSAREVTQIGIAYAVLTFDLVLIFAGGTFLSGAPATGLFQGFTVGWAALAATAAFTGFVAHELAHKIVAERRGYWAEFRMWPSGLLLSLLMSFIGFLWGAPGATMVGGMPETNRADWGRTSVAGPLTNVAFGLAFLGAGLAAFRLASSLALPLLYLGWINGWFGTFNLIPVGPLDGRKVVRWSVGLWAAAIVFTGAVTVVSLLAVFSFETFGTPFHYFALAGR
ncbi:MAG TPA: metalloprotease [Thermoplasmata archaeon]|nr:metalloprotease [Thermoplasmata archaeon]